MNLYTVTYIVGGVEATYQRNIPAEHLYKYLREVREEGLGKPNFHLQGQGGW
jgi:hypothetical protein